MFKSLQKKIVSKIIQKIDIILDQKLSSYLDNQALIKGKVLSNQNKILANSNFRNEFSPKNYLHDYEFKIFSQWQDDGIIQFLIQNIAIKNYAFIEFGVEDFMESNCRFLMMNNNYQGFVMDGSQEKINHLKNQHWFWKYDLQCQAVFIDKDNINELIKNSQLNDIAVLHIDLDGNDYWILENIDLSVINPAILIMEYNSIFGKKRAISVPYDKVFNRTNYHYSNLFQGASLSALNYQAEKKGYSLIGCNSAGNNCYFVRNDLLNNKVYKLSIEEAYVESKFRESRNQKGELSFLRDQDRINQIKDLEVVNVIENKLEKF